MLHAAVVRVIVRGVNGAHVVEMKARWRRVVLKGELGVQAPQVDRFLDHLGRRHELGFAGRVRLRAVALSPTRSTRVRA